MKKKNPFIPNEGLHYMILNIIKSIGAVVVMIMIVWQLDLQLSVQSVPMTSKVVARIGEVYSIHYVIKFFLVT